MKKILNSLQRITTTNKFIPEIDGLRFIAIISVILYHINSFMIEKNNYIYINSSSKYVISNILARGHLGVELFFVISGFILCYPFASNYINNTTLPNIKQYFLRRLTRLEPPYILVMVALFFALIFLKKYTFLELLPSLFASLSNTHNIFYPNQLPFINAVAWSLEIEVQFYIIVPLFARIFVFPPIQRRLMIVSFVILITIFQSLIKTEIPLIFNYFQYFGIGFILTDLALTKTKIYFNNIFSILLGIFSFCLIWYSDIKGTNLTIISRIFFQLLLTLSIFVFYYLVLFNDIWKRIFSA